MNLGESFLAVLGIFAYVGLLFGLIIYGVNLIVMDRRIVLGNSVLVAAMAVFFFGAVFVLSQS